MEPERRWSGSHGSLTLSRPAPGVVLVPLEGTDVGEFGEEPFGELMRLYSNGADFDAALADAAQRARRGGA